MITKITASNDRELFAPRFAQITAALEEAGTPIEINSLESYFANLISISRLQTSKGAAGKYLLVMPPDEPYFEIDANTRIINIPSHFKKNGVGVQGDNEAELIVFKIDRYFDYKDFMETKIAINWNFTPAGSRLPVYEDTQVQAAFAPDDELEPGYVVFGFFVTKEMTPAKGTLSFSVTCYTESNDQIDYSFNTQTATMAINEGLMLTDPTAVKNIASSMLPRITDSSYTPESLTPIETPVWQLGAIDPEDENSVLGLPEEINFPLYDDGTEPATMTLVTQAYTPGVVNMNYSWYFAPDEGTVFVGAEPSVTTRPSDYFVTQDLEPNEGSLYYLKNEDNTINPVPLTYEDEELLEAWNDPDTEVYELGSSYDAVRAGRVQVKAQAESVTTLSNGTQLRAVSDMIESNVCIIPPAAKPEVALNVATALDEERDNFTVEDDSAGFVYISSTVPPEINAIVTVPEGEELGAVAVEVVNNADLQELDEETIILNTWSNENTEGKYKFEKDDTEAHHGNYVVTSGGVLTEGEYCVRAINRRNHTYSVSEPSETIRTSFVAPEITKLTLYTIYNDTQVIMLDKGQSPSISQTIGNQTNEGYSIELNDQHPSLTFVIDDETEAANVYEDASTSYFVEELNYNASKGEWELSYRETSPNPDIIEVMWDNGYADADHLNGAYVFTINRDPGIYRIRTENRYHGTLRVGYTGLFKIVST